MMKESVLADGERLHPVDAPRSTRSCMEASKKSHQGSISKVIRSFQ
jgi:hypothetical protein